jgi:hypothetical protein
MGNYPSRAASALTFFRDSAVREREDAAFCESMQFVQQECLDNSDDESDEMNATALKKKRAKKWPVLECTDKHRLRKELLPCSLTCKLVASDLCRTDR